MNLHHNILLYALCLLLSIPAYAGGKADGLIRVCPQDHGGALVNPSMGWTMHFYSNVPSNYGSRLEASDVVEYFPGISTVYLRIPWSFLEPEEGHICWEILDTPAQRWIQAGMKVAFRITSTENWTRQGTPQWVFDAGAKYYEVDGYLEPEYDDPIFLDKLEHFLARMAERYDNNPNVAFIDVGHFGMWGEGHTVMTSPRHGKEWGIDTQKRYIDLYCKYFKHTQLCISDDFAGHNTVADRYAIMEYALFRGVTMRDDSILVQPAPNHWFHADMAQPFWPLMPVILEHEHYGNSVNHHAWDKELLLQSVEDYHASYMSIHWWPDELLKANRDVIERINRRLGYRIQLASIQWPARVKKDEAFTITSAWRNAGVAPCYPGGYPCFTIKDKKGGIVAALVEDRFNVKQLTVDEPGKAKSDTVTSTFTIAKRYGTNKEFFRTCRPGKYELYFSVGSMDGTPTLQLPYGHDDAHKRYKVGTIIVEE